MKHKYFTTKVNSAIEAVLLAHLAHKFGWAVESERTRDYEGYNQIMLDVNNRYIWGQAQIAPEAEVVDVDRFVELVKTIQPLPEIVLDGNTIARLSYDRTEARIYGRTVRYAEASKWAQYLTPRGTDLSKLQTRAVAVNLGNENEVRLAASVLRAKGFTVSSPTDPDYFVGYVGLGFDLIDKEAWGSSEPVKAGGTYRVVSLDDFLVLVEESHNYTKVETSFVYDTYVSPDGGVVHAGCKTIPSESILEVIRQLVPEKVEVAPAPPVAEETHGTIAVDIPELPPLYNPQGLTEEEYGAAEGYRLLHEDEHGRSFTGRKGVLALQQLNGGRGGTWSNGGSTGNSTTVVYRTKLTREQLAKVRSGELPNEYHVPVSPQAEEVAAARAQQDEVAF